MPAIQFSLFLLNPEVQRHQANIFETNNHFTFPGYLTRAQSLLTYWSTRFQNTCSNESLLLGSSSAPLPSEARPCGSLAQEPQYNDSTHDVSHPSQRSQPCCKFFEIWNICTSRSPINAARFHDAAHHRSYCMCVPGQAVPSTIGQTGPFKYMCTNTCYGERRSRTCPPSSARVFVFGQGAAFSVL